MSILRHLTIKELCRFILHNQNPNFDYKEAAEELAKKTDTLQEIHIKKLQAQITELEHELLKYNP
jgi:predicted AAA+ superfamily ATPase